MDRSKAEAILAAVRDRLREGEGSPAMAEFMAAWQWFMDYAATIEDMELLKRGERLSLAMEAYWREQLEIDDAREVVLKSLETDIQIPGDELSKGHLN